MADDEQTVDTVPPAPPDPLAGLRAALEELLVARDLWHDAGSGATNADAERLDAAFERWNRELSAIGARLERADALAGAARAVKDHLDRPPTSGGIGWTMAQTTLEDEAWAALAAYEAGEGRPMGDERTLGNGEETGWPGEFRCPHCGVWLTVVDDYRRITCAVCGGSIDKPAALAAYEAGEAS